MTTKNCSIQYCSGKYFAKGYCQAHYQRKLDGRIIATPIHRKRGNTRHPLYSTYRGMINRCENTKMDNYRNYGAKGVTVCERWRNDFWLFVVDMGEKPTEKHTLDRKDPMGNYEPDNCRWATRVEQYHNKRKE